MKFKVRYYPEESISTACMADIAFLLIIFFMVTTAFSVKKGINYNLPKEEEQLQKQDAVIVEIREQTSLLLNNSKVSLQKLTTELQKLLALNPRKIVIIQANDDINYGLLIAVLDKIKLAGAINISIPSKEELKAWRN